MKSYLKTVKTDTNTIITTDGELMEVEVITHDVVVESKEEFYLVYASLIGLLGNLSSGAVKTLSYILLTFKKDTEFEIGGGTRAKIAKLMNISVSNVANALTELKAYNILYSPQKSFYMINPKYVYQGSTTNRKASMKAMISLGCKECI